MRLCHEPTKGLVLSQERKPYICELASAAGVTGSLRIFWDPSFAGIPVGGCLPLGHGRELTLFWGSEEPGAGQLPRAGKSHGLDPEG